METGCPRGIQLLGDFYSNFDGQVMLIYCAEVREEWVGGKRKFRYVVAMRQQDES